MPERRKSARQRILKGAKIAFSGHHAVIDCTARNIGRGGACLIIANPVGIPDDFDLIFDNNDYGTRPCHIIWRTDTRLGVEFRSTRKAA